MEQPPSVNRSRLIPILLLCLVPAVDAATRYVSDDFQITLRSGKSTTHKVLKSLRSGTRLEVVTAEDDSGYAKVRTDDGTEGYVLARFLMDTRSARDRLTRAEAQLRELQQEPEKLTSQLIALRQEYETLKSSNAQNEQTNARLQQELDQIKTTAANAVALAEDRDKLRNKVSELTQQLDDLKLRNLQLQNHSDKKWFMTGAGVIFAGILLGLILPRLRVRRRRDSWGSGSITIP